MKNRKMYTLVLLCVIFALSIFGCGSKSLSDQEKYDDYIERVYKPFHDAMGTHLSVSMRMVGSKMNDSLEQQYNAFENESERLVEAKNKVVEIEPAEFWTEEQKALFNEAKTNLTDVLDNQVKGLTMDKENLIARNTHSENIIDSLHSLGLDKKDNYFDASEALMREFAVDGVEEIDYEAYFAEREKEMIS